MHSDWRSADGNAGAGYGVSFRAGGQLPAKIETKQDLPAQELEESFGEAFAMAAEDAEFREDEEPAVLIETGRALVRRIAPSTASESETAAGEEPKAQSPRPGHGRNSADEFKGANRVWLPIVLI
ncbi:MAG TPA: hypothetical protein VKB77_09380, partial [Terriglobales bacterium]|nr:hypothetical protein [Terriglobales bacterium]